MKQAPAISRGTGLRSYTMVQESYEDSEPRFCLIVRSRDYEQNVVVTAVIGGGLSPVEVGPQSWRAIYATLKPVITIAFVDASDPQGLGELTELSEELHRGTLLAVVPNVEQVPFVLAAGTMDFLTDDMLEAAIPAQLAAMLRRMVPEEPERGGSRILDLSVGVGIDRGARRLIGPDRTVSLSPFEMSLLMQLAEHRGQAIPAQVLLSVAKGREASEFDASRTVKTYVRRIRKKFESVGASPALIATVRSAGYMMELPERVQ